MEILIESTKGFEGDIAQLIDILPAVKRAGIP